MYILQSKTDNGIFNVDQKVIKASALLKNVCAFTEITDPIVVNCSSLCLSTFINLINHYDDISQDHDVEIEKQLFADFDDEKLVGLVKEMCVLDSDFFLDSVADLILDRIEGLLGGKILQYFQFDDDFSVEEREAATKNRLKYMLSIDVGPLKFPFKNTCFTNLKNKFSTPMNALLARIVRRANHGTGFRLSLINKTLKQEIDKNPVKVNSLKCGEEWVVRNAFGTYELSGYHIDIIKARKMTADSDVTLVYNSHNATYDNVLRASSLDFVFPSKSCSTLNVEFSHNKYQIYDYDSSRSNFSSVSYSFSSISMGFAEFYKQLVAKDLSKEIHIQCRNLLEAFHNQPVEDNALKEYVSEYSEMFKKPNATRFHQFVVSRNILHDITEFKKFIKDTGLLTEYMEEGGIVTSKGELPNVPKETDENLRGEETEYEKLMREAYPNYTYEYKVESLKEFFVPPDMPVKPVRVSVVALNQWAMDFDGNLKRVVKSVKAAHSQGSTIRVGVELELSGYSCLDHFFEMDTETRCWNSLSQLLRHSKNFNMIIVTGMPVKFRAAIYNCMIVCALGKIVLIHPKNAMCDDDVYRESRYFKLWENGTELQMFNVKQHYIDQDDVPFGHGIVETLDGVKVAIEICEELWAATSPSVLWALNGVDLICNGSASHHVLGKSAKRICQLVQDLSTKLGGVYLYSNLRGYDGDRLYFNGMSAIVQNGKIYKQIEQFDLEDVAVESALLDLNRSATYRTKIASLGELSSRADLFPTITAHIEVIRPHDNNLDVPFQPTFLDEGQEILRALPGDLWHYLRRSNAAGYFLPLSGGADSEATAAIIYLMCEKVCQAVASYKEKGIPPDSSLYFHGKPIEEKDPKKLVSRLFFTSYMKSKNSSKETEDRARAIAECIGANFSVQSIDATVESLKETFVKAHHVDLTHEHPDPRARLALENIQARSGMVLAYMNAQLLPVSHGLNGSLLVLGSSNVDESLVGNLTEHDCSSADINPIGSINKIDLKLFLSDFAGRGFTPFHDVVGAKPSAEL